MPENWDGRERRADYLAILDNRLSTLHEDVGDIKAVLKDLTSAITRLAVMEERMTTASAAQERAFNAISTLEKRLTEVEKKLPEVTRTSIWVDRGVWAAAAAAAVYIAKKTGLM